MKEATNPMIGTTKMTNDLHTLAYRIDPAILEAVTVYELDDRFWQEWENLTNRVRGARNGHEQPRYFDLATALVAITSQPVKLFRHTGLESRDRSKALLITTQPIDPWLLETTFTAFESRVRRDDAGKLGRLITEAPVNEIQISTVIEAAQEAGAEPPRWVYDFASWSYAARLAATPFTIDHMVVNFRLDTTGNLLAWDRPLLVDAGKPPTRAGVGTTYLETGVRTMRGGLDLYFVIQPHVARVPRSWYRARNAWVARDDNSPIMRLPVTGPWKAKGITAPIYRNHTAAIVQACQMAELPQPPDEPLQADASAFRLIGKPNSSHPIGKGTGVRFAHQVRKQVATILEVEPLTFARSGLSAGPRVSGPIAATALDAAVEESGSERVRIVGIYSDTRTRFRLTKALSQYASNDTDWAVHEDGEPTALSERIDVIFEHAPQLVRHGDHIRNPSELASLTPPKNGAVLALVETTRPSSGEEGIDAKPRLRLALGECGVISQFIDAGFEQKTQPDEPSQPDHPSISAVRDLFRAGGIMDSRVRKTLTEKKSGNIPLTQPATFVGLHLRKHTPPRGKGRPAMIIALVALVASGDQHPWALRMYDAPSGRWLPYREASACYFTQPIGDESISGAFDDSLDDLRIKIDTAVKQLPYDQPIVLFIDPHAGPAENTWRGIRRTDDGTGWLPGSGVEHSDLAVVTIRTGTNAIRPTDRGVSKSDPGKPALPGQDLYAHNEPHATTWMLAQKSRAFRGNSHSSRIGAEKTRWAEGVTKARMKEDWHHLNCVEINIAGPSSTFSPEQLAVFTARLCNQSISWDDRTRLPVPLHLAKSVVTDHPGFIADGASEE